MALDPSLVSVVEGALSEARTARPRASRRPVLDLFWTMVRTDFKSRYHGGKASGFFWALLKPVVMFVVLFGVFSLLFKREDYVFNLMVAITLWDFFSEATTSGLVSLSSRSHLLGRVRFPRAIVVVASLANAGVRLLVSSGVVLLAICLWHRPPGPAHVALFVLYSVLLTAMILGFSLAASVLFHLYRDLNQIWELVLHAGFFVAPIIYPIDIFPERIHRYLYAWPPTPAISFAREVLVAGTIPTFKAHLLFVAEALAALAIGALVYRRNIDRAVERL